MKWEVSNIILERIFDSSSYIVYGNNKKEALRDYIENLIYELQNMSDSDIERIADDSDDLIYEPIVMNIKAEQKDVK